MRTAEPLLGQRSTAYAQDNVCMGKKLEEKGYADVLDIVPEFREKCVHAGEFVAAANHFF